MKFHLCLKNHCIETALKRHYNLTLSSYFKNPNLELEKNIEVLERLLTGLDFSYLRSKYKELSGGKDVNICITVEDIKANKIGIEICHEQQKKKIEIKLTDHK